MDYVILNLEVAINKVSSVFGVGNYSTYKSSCKKYIFRSFFCKKGFNIGLIA